MKRFWFVLSCGSVFLTAGAMLACGAGARLQSVTINPSTATGQAQFVAAGIYTNGDKVSPLPALWSEHNPWAMTTVGTDIRVDPNGMVTCLSVAGTFPVLAIAPVDPHVPISKMDMRTPQVMGAASITCP